MSAALVRLGRSARRHAGAGYTLIEMMVVMALLSVLAAAVLPLAEVSQQRQKERELRRALWEIRDAIDAYKRAHDAREFRDAPHRIGYPASLQALVDGMPAASGQGRVRFLRRIPRDPFADPSLPAAETWALRSYASSADRPEPGADVYDVRSRSSRVGLNGIPVAQW